MPMRNCIRRSSGTSRFRSAMAAWIAMAHSTALTTLGNVGEDAVAGGIDDCPAMRSDQRQHDRLMRLEVADGGVFVRAHQRE